MSVTLAILILTGIVSYQGFNNRNIIESLKHHPYSEHNKKEYYRLISSGFVHANWMHLGINGFVLYMFGTQIERVFMINMGEIKGIFFYILLYFTSIIAGDLVTHLQHKDNYGYSAVGASGATSALVLIYCMLMPWEWLDFPPVPSIVFAVGFLGYSYWADKTGRADGIGHSAHLYGALWGLAFFFVTDPSMLSLVFERLMEGPKGFG